MASLLLTSDGWYGQGEDAMWLIGYVRRSDHDLVEIYHFGLPVFDLLVQTLIFQDNIQ